MTSTLSILDLAPVPQGARPATPCATRSTSRATPSPGAIAATGSPSTTTWSASPARRRRWRSAISPEARRRSGSARAESCCPITRRWSSPSSSARWRRSIPAASISASAGRREPTRLTLRALRRAPEAAEHFPQDVLELQALLGDLQPGQRIQAVPGDRHESAALDSRLEPVRRAARRHARPALRLRLAFRARRADAGAGHLSRALRAVRAIAAAACDGRRQRDRGGDRRGGAPAVHLGRSRASPISCAGRAASCGRRSTTSRPIGRRRKRRMPRACSPAPSSDANRRGWPERFSANGPAPTS